MMRAGFIVAGGGILLIELIVNRLIRKIASRRGGRNSPHARAASPQALDRITTDRQAKLCDEIGPRVASCANGLRIRAAA
jgi:hypothetical protein